LKIEFKPDWEETKERYLAWWAHEIIDRCALSVEAPRAVKSKASAPVVPKSIKDRWFDKEYLLAANEYRMSNTYFGGEALPSGTPDIPAGQIYRHISVRISTFGKTLPGAIR